MAISLLTYLYHPGLWLRPDNTKWCRETWRALNGNPHSKWGWVKTLVPLVNPKIAGKWMFIPLELTLIGIDLYPNEGNQGIVFPIIIQNGMIGMKKSLIFFPMIIPVIIALQAKYPTTDHYGWMFNDIYPYIICMYRLRTRSIYVFFSCFSKRMGRAITQITRDLPFWENMQFCFCFSLGSNYRIHEPCKIKS